MRTIRVVAVTVGLLGLVAAACGDGGDVATDRPGDGGGAPSAAEPPDGPGGGEALVGREFLAEAVTEGGQPVELVTGTRIRLTFHDDGRLTVHAGCNTLDATPTISADRIDVGDGLSTTDMGCDPTLHDQDGWLADLLTAGPTYVLDGDRLTLTAGDRVVELLDREVADPDRPLEGTTWTLDGLIDGDVASSVPGDVAATVTFADGAVTVEGTGCNGGGGSYTLDEAAHEVTVPALAWTRMACEGPSASVEAALGAVLDGTVGYEIEAAHLTLTHPGGKGLTLRAG